MAYKLRTVTPHPAGGEYPKTELPDAQKMANVDIGIRALRQCMEHAVIPRLLEAYNGNTHQVASGLAMLFGDEMRKFFRENRAEGQEPTLAVYDEIMNCFVHNVDTLKARATMEAMGLGHLTNNPNVTFLFI